MSEDNRLFIEGELLSWPGVTAGPHRFGGTEFQLEGKEIGHLHGGHLVDMPFPRTVRDELVASGQAEPHHIYPESGWVSVYLKTEEDVRRGVDLLRLNYERILRKGTLHSKPGGD